MRRLLVAVDGSPSSDRAVRFLIRDRHREEFAAPSEVHLLNVQPPVPGDVSSFIAGEDIKAYHREQGLEALKSARQALDEAGIAYEFHVAVGKPAQIIAAFAREKQCTQILMGTHGRTGLTHVLMGSVTSEVIRLADVPVQLVK